MLLLLLLAGWFTWTLAEYVFHRFGMHQAKGRGLASREHLFHHANRDSVLEKWALSWSGVLLFGAGFAWVLHPAFGLGWVVGYGFYDWQHYWAHRRAPRNRYQRFVRRHHFHHHFGHPMANHGVTWPLWDKVFGTHEVPGTIKVPRRLAMVWLVDDLGAVKAEFAGDYEVVGRRAADAQQAALDLTDAYANRAPELV
jgi:hypothetical protein